MHSKEYSATTEGNRMVGGRLSPTAYRYGFDQAFCGRTRQHSPHLRYSEFPSWSWLAWNDAVLFDRQMIQAVLTSRIIHRSPHISISPSQPARVRKAKAGRIP